MEINWTQIIVQLIVTVGAFAGLVAPLYFQQRRTHDSVEKKVIPLLDETVKSVNGMKDAQIKAERSQAHDAGVLDEKAAAQVRQDELRGTKEDRRVP